MYGDAGVNKCRKERGSLWSVHGAISDQTATERAFARQVTSPGPFSTLTRGECQLDSVVEVRRSASKLQSADVHITLAPFILPWWPLYG